MPCIPFFFIYLSNCCEFTWLPESLGQLPALTTLKLIECRGLTVLPAWVEQLTTWVSLGLPSFIRALPRWVAQLVALTVIDRSQPLLHVEGPARVTGPAGGADNPISGIVAI
jgi:hypothetical protein